MTELKEASNGGPQATRERIRGSLFKLTALALAFYFGFIALTFYRSHR